MKLYPECVPCMLQRALMFCSREDEKTRTRVMEKLCELFSKEISGDITTTGLAFKRNMIIEGLIDNDDPMKELKGESFDAALKVYPLLEDYLEREKNDRKRFKKALKVALAGNIIEFGARDHRVNLEKLEDEIFDVVGGNLAIDDTDEIYERVKDAKEILYVTDNAGEIVFDKLFIRELMKYAEVYVAPLSRPVQDDAWIDDARRVGIDKLCKIIPRGDFIGVWFEKCTPEFLKKFEDADFIIAKGMGCYETLVDHPERLKGKIALLMKAKCAPVAKNVKVPLGSAVVKLL
jgi:uncharacterized protein with ATP-grasp and redox domains